VQFNKSYKAQVNYCTHKVTGGNQSNIRFAQMHSNVECKKLDMSSIYKLMKLRWAAVGIKYELVKSGKIASHKKHAWPPIKIVN